MKPPGYSCSSKTLARRLASLISVYPHAHVLKRSAIEQLAKTPLAVWRGGHFFLLWQTISFLKICNSIQLCPRVCGVFFKGRKHSCTDVLTVAHHLIRHFEVFCYYSPGQKRKKSNYSPTSQRHKEEPYAIRQEPAIYTLPKRQYEYGGITLAASESRLFFRRWNFHLNAYKLLVTGK